ncbi:MAG: M28 family peptidase [Fidelibacterota bacterium]
MKRIPALYAYLTVCQFLVSFVWAESSHSSGKRTSGFRSQLPINPLVEEMVNKVSEEELLSNLTALVGFHTRHTSSDTTSPDTGIGAARDFIFAKFEEYGHAGGGTMEASFFVFPATVCDVFNAAHKNVLATIPGTTWPERIFIASGHMDDRTVDRCDYTSFAPGANDDGSGTVVSMELARVLGQYTENFESTVILMTVTGEDEGLYGSRAYADWALENDLDIDGMITNDVVGNIEGCVDPACPPGEEVIIDSTSVRHFSGNPSTSTSRQLSRYMKLKGERYVTDVGWTINLIPSIDRPGRGGDHMPFYDNGYPAVRFTEPHEYGDGSGQNGRQHNEMDLVEFVNVPYLARIVKTNIAGLAILAMAPDRPTGLQAEDSRTGSEIQLNWPRTNSESDFAGYRVAYRVTYPEESLFYDNILDVGNVNEYVLTGLRPNVPLYVSISAYDTSGNESIFSDEVLVTPTVVEGISVTPTYAAPGIDSVVVSARVVSDTHGVSLLSEIELLDGTLLDTLLLLDDGEHGDGHAGDSLFANVWPVPSDEERNYFVNLRITVTSGDSLIRSYLRQVGVFTTVGPVVLDGITFLGDSLPDPGDDVLFWVDLTNKGRTATAEEVTAQIWTESPCPSYMTPVAYSFGDIGVGSTARGAYPYRTGIGEDCPSGTRIPVTVSVYSHETLFWSDGFTLEVSGGVGVDGGENLLPEKYDLKPNYPNPFNPSTVIRYSLPESAFVSLIVYDAGGRQVERVVSTRRQAGHHSVRWDGGNLPSGVYLIKMVAADPSTGSGQVFNKTVKVALIK